MDPITAAVVAALTAGAAGIATEMTEVGKKAVTDAYEALKAAIRNKFGQESKVVKAVNELKANPILGRIKKPWKAAFSKSGQIKMMSFWPWLKN